MPDHFALLNEPRRPWLEPEALKQKFLRLSATVHPDRVHHLGEAERAAAQEQYLQFNTAYNCLREPKDRLRHLLELELGTIPRDIQRIPSDLMDLSLAIGQACRQAEVFLTEKAKVTSPLLKVQLFEKGEQQRDALLALRQTIDARRDTLIGELKRLDADWKPVDGGKPGEAIARVEELYRLFSYFARWEEQLQERIARLSF
jgi:DnaJ-domain-containing protein 1